MGDAQSRAGFTLLELALVAAIVGVILAVALPQLMPAIAYGKLEGAARHVANFGRAAVARATMARERLTVRVDLANQEYWAVRWVEIKLEEEGEEEDDGLAGGFNRDPYRNLNRGGLFKNSPGGLFGDKGEGGGLFNRTRAESYMKFAPGLAGVFGEAEEDTEEQAERMADRFDRFLRLQVMARAENVTHEGLLSEIGPLFDKEFTLDATPVVEDEEEIMDDILSREVVPDGVWIDSVYVGNKAHSGGVVEIEISPLGLTEPITFYLRNEDGDYYTVVWDAITGGAHLESGKGASL
jgi:prepilin-type N-terminal cleavage/methylation domain-containing protein